MYMFSPPSSRLSGRRQADVYRRVQEAGAYAALRVRLRVRVGGDGHRADTGQEQRRREATGQERWWGAKKATEAWEATGQERWWGAKKATEASATGLGVRVSGCRVGLYTRLPFPILIDIVPVCILYLCCGGQRKQQKLPPLDLVLTFGLACIRDCHYLY